MLIKGLWNRFDARAVPVFQIVCHFYYSRSEGKVGFRTRLTASASLILVFPNGELGTWTVDFSSGLKVLGSHLGVTGWSAWTDLWTGTCVLAVYLSAWDLSFGGDSILFSNLTSLGGLPWS
jgi:heme A synthase